MRLRLRRSERLAEPAREELSADDRRIVERALPYTMTGVPRLVALVEAVRYCVRRGVPGSLAECGVWRGGSVLAMLLTLQEQDADDRDVYIYDSFEGMPEPSERDGLAVRREWEAGRAWPEPFDSEQFSEEAVRETLLATGYPEERLHIVPGPVERTLPAGAPERLALLRLDTDWYESTRHELENLYPRLADGGVLIVDDYGHYQGCRQAVDEYFSRHAQPVLLSRIDYTGRIAVKH